MEVVDKAIDLARDLTRQVDFIRENFIADEIGNYNNKQKARFDRNRINISQDMLDFSKLLYSGECYEEV